MMGQHLALKYQTASSVRFTFDTKINQMCVDEKCIVARFICNYDFFLYRYLLDRVDHQML